MPLLIQWTLSHDVEMSWISEAPLRFPSECSFTEEARHSSSLLLDFTSSFNLLRLFFVGKLQKLVFGRPTALVDTDVEGALSAIPEAIFVCLSHSLF